jgi:hypothetical protein
MQRVPHEPTGAARLGRTGLLALALLAACDADRYPIGSGLPEGAAGAGGNGPSPGDTSLPAMSPSGAPSPTPAATGGCSLPGAPMPVRAVTISSFQVADRLSRFLWSRPADDAFLQVVTRSNLATTGDVAAVASVLLDDLRASSTVHAFYQKWLGLVPPQPGMPGFTPELALSLLPETNDLAFYLTRFGGSFADLLQAPFSLLTPVLGEFYGVEVMAGGPHRVDLDPTQRGGVLTHASWLIAHPTPSARGLWVNNALYCEPVPAAPPPDIHVDPNPNMPATARERLEQETSLAACQGCHTLIDPPGFLYENYDRFGRYRTLDNGRPVNARATVRLPGYEGSLEKAAALGKIAAGSCEAQACFVKHWLTRATGIEEPDPATVEEVTAAFRASRLGLRDLMIAVTQSRLFLQP